MTHRKYGPCPLRLPSSNRQPQVCKQNRWVTLSLTGDLDARKRQVGGALLQPSWPPAVQLAAACWQRDIAAAAVLLLVGACCSSAKLAWALPESVHVVLQPLWALARWSPAGDGGHIQRSGAPLLCAAAVVQSRWASCCAGRSQWAAMQLPAMGRGCAVKRCLPTNISALPSRPSKQPILPPHPAGGCGLNIVGANRLILLDPRCAPLPAAAR